VRASGNDAQVNPAELAEIASLSDAGTVKPVVSACIFAGKGVALRVCPRGLTAFIGVCELLGVPTLLLAHH
jgi:hypothetical protein